MTPELLTPEEISGIRREFPALSLTVHGRPLVYLDNTATSQTPRRVVEAVTDMYYNHKANVHRGVYTLAQESTEMMEAARKACARFVNASSDREIIFTRGTTEAINLVAASYGQLLEPGDEIIVTVMEHHSNLVPWQLLCSRRGLRQRVVPLSADGDGSLDLDAYRSLFNERTRLVSFCHVSNVLGTVNPVAEMVAEAHRHGAVAVIDGAQAAPHIRLDMRALDADFYAFSAHKMYGPSGVGVLYGKKALLEHMPPYQGGGEMIDHVRLPEGTTFEQPPLKFEAGTPDFVGIAAFARAIEFVEQIGIERIAAHERALLDYTTAQMETIEGMRIFGSTPGKEGVISFLIGRAHHYDTGLLLDKLGVAVRTGHHCAQPLMEALGIEGTVRASFAVYNTLEEADAFIAALRRIAPMLQ
ncbi:MAG: cysteine desulfurase [Clostridium sp.]|nr:cysteine desulfurase [Clostridium sp.]